MAIFSDIKILSSSNCHRLGAAHFLSYFKLGQSPDGKIRKVLVIVVALANLAFTVCVVWCL